MKENMLLEREHKEKVSIQQKENELNKRNREMSAPIQDTKPQDRSEPVSTKVEIEPDYPGGKEGWQNYLAKNLRYPVEAMDKKISGTVIVQFIVGKDGKVSDIEAIKGPSELRDGSVRIIRESGTWLPARENGRIVKAYRKQAVVFEIVK
jgi:protein TonB